MYDKVSTNLNFSQREQEILKFWDDNKIFEQSVKLREGDEHFTFYDGPPTANGLPHIGHILTRVIKDIIPRYKLMKGYNVLRKAGWDTHGLPVELEVEKKLNISGKPEIEKYGIEPFIKQCKESVWKYEKEWRDMSDRVGFWLDMNDPYITYKNDYIESVWWSIKQIWEKGLLYKGHKVVPYCPRCGTALSSHEVAQGYQDVKEESLIAKFKVKGKDKEYLLAWTTTPWTLPSNLALCVNAKENYAKVKTNDEVYILAEALVSQVINGDYDIVEIVKGEQLVGTEYEPLFNFFELDKKAWYVVSDNYVTLTDGTGIVHLAPAFGEDDARICRKNDLPFVQPVRSDGTFDESVKNWTGLFVKDADPKIIEELKRTGKYYSSAVYEHSYPFCWRCHTALIYYARDAWFIAMTKIKDILVKNNETVNWYPENIKRGRFGNFLENVIDWGLSRERYWGTPLPIWECKCGHRHAIGGIDELKKMSDNCPENIELHKPYIDAVNVRCDKCGEAMTRVTEVIDCWYDSGAMPFAQWHYPYENKDKFDKLFPADFISEAIDQTRGWFYSLIAISTAVFGVSPYKNVIVMGHVQDKDGKKMSKHLGNVTDPWGVLEKQGADAVRWYFYVNSAPWLPSRFYEDAVSEAQRKFMGTLWNTYAFYVLYGNIDNFNPTEHKLEYDKINVLDKWALSKLNSLIKTVEASLDAYKITEAARALQEFTDDLSNWYVRRSRERFWAKGMPQDKVNAYMTLYTILESLAGICAPFIPFMSESIYQNLVRNVRKDAPDSVHLTDFPVCIHQWVDNELEKNMDAVLKIVTAGRAARNYAGIKNRQPLSVMYVKHDTVISAEFMDIVKDELNVKQVEYRDDAEKYISYKFKPQLRTLGPKYGKLLPRIGQWLGEQDGNKLMLELNKENKLVLTIAETEILLLREDLLIETGQAEGYSVCEDKNVIAVLSTELTDELIEEGFVREIISKIQTMRKEADFEVMDRIDIGYVSTPKIAEIIFANGNELKEETLCDTITEGELNGYSKEWDINGENAVFYIIRK